MEDDERVARMQGKLGADRNLARQALESSLRLLHEWSLVSHDY
jgi:hypothetical protein